MTGTNAKSLQELSKRALDNLKEAEADEPAPEPKPEPATVRTTLFDPVKGPAVGTVWTKTWFEDKSRRFIVDRVDVGKVFYSSGFSTWDYLSTFVNDVISGRDVL